MPSWAMRSTAGVRASCELFGTSACNSTGDLGATLKRIEAEAYQRWLFNHSSQWIDAVFEAEYRAERAVYERALGSSGSALPIMVDATDGLEGKELSILPNVTTGPVAA